LASVTWIPISVGDITIMIPYTPESVVYKDDSGNLYIKLSSAHGSKLIKLSKSLYWTSSEVSQDEWDELSLTITDYTLSYGNFVGDSSQDLKINNNNGEIIIENSNGNYFVSQPADSPDDASIGSIDADGNGIRDDIELKISQLAPINSLKNGYLQHTAFYTRAFLLETSNVNKKRFLIEIMKGYACLSSTSNDEDAYAQIVAGHLDSKERFEQYTRNNNFLNQESITVNNMGCVLKGTGVEIISGCDVVHFVFGPRNIYEGLRTSTLKGMNMGENVKVTITIENERITGSNTDPGGSFLASIHFGKPWEKLQPALASQRVEENTAFTYVRENYNFDTDGFIYGKADDYIKDSVVRMTFTCESN
jgi:hypothetical protein